MFKEPGFNNQPIEKVEKKEESVLKNQENLIFIFKFRWMKLER